MASPLAKSESGAPLSQRKITTTRSLGFLETEWRPIERKENPENLRAETSLRLVSDNSLNMIQFIFCGFDQVTTIIAVL